MVLTEEERSSVQISKCALGATTILRFRDLVLTLRVRPQGYIVYHWLIYIAPDMIG